MPPILGSSLILVSGKGWAVSPIPRPWLEGTPSLISSLLPLSRGGDFPPFYHCLELFSTQHVSLPFLKDLLYVGSPLFVLPWPQGRLRGASVS